MRPIHCVSHPVALEKIGRLRDRSTGVSEFRQLVRELAVLLAIEATRDLTCDEYIVQTPVAPAKAVRTVEPIVLVPILRAGLGMVEGMLQWMPEARVGHLGMYRDPQTLSPVEYYANTPPGLDKGLVIVLDPMLATGGSAAAALAALKARGARRIKLTAIIAAPEGIAKLDGLHPDVELYAIAVDEGLNSHGYIVPGLGDAGDRIFGTL
ncbi:MAG: uracil phosphoribosyltransferase [Bacilli bacterium]